MPDLHYFREKLTQSLEDHLDQPQVDVAAGDAYHVMGFVVSPTFEAMDDDDRQVLVWDRVLKTFDPREQDQLEFIYTNAPSEMASEEQSATSQQPE